MASQYFLTQNTVGDIKPLSYFEKFCVSIFISMATSLCVMCNSIRTDLMVLLIKKLNLSLSITGKFKIF